MILVEGPDGAGKSRLIEQLRKRHGLKFADGPKTSTSLGGTSQYTRDELADWVDLEMARWIEPGYGPMIYDRYPLISEPIYGQIVRNSLPGKFLTGWYRGRVAILRKSCLVVFVDPGWDLVEKGSAAESQMAGVDENLHKIWLAYRTLAMSWSGNSVIYDRNSPQSTLVTVGRVANHLEKWRF